MAPREVKIFSLHRPRNFLQQNNKTFEKCEHTYQDKYFKKMTYFSDSGGRDVRKTLFDISIEEKIKPLHILLHPIWWTSKSLTPTSTLSKLLKKHNQFLMSETAKSCKTFNLKI